MNKISKILAMSIVILAIVTVTLSVSAFSNNDLISYVTGKHTVLGGSYQLNANQIAEVKSYLEANPVDDATAAAIKADLDAAVKELNATGATGIDKVDNAVKTKVTSLLQSAGSKAGVTVTVNANAKTISVKDANGNSIITGSYSALTSDSTSQSTSGTLVYTGSNYIVGISALAIVAVAVVLVIRKRA